MLVVENDGVSRDSLLLSADDERRIKKWITLLPHTS